MNQITELFNSISDEELRQGIKEMQEDSEKGIIREGVMRKYATKVSNITGQPVSSTLFLSEMCLLRQAAYRYTK